MESKHKAIRWPPRSGTKQQGYATVFTLLLFTAVALAMFSMYDVGQTTSDKLRLENTADAAAYSTATMVARDFNFIAYTNRAMIANQAVIGQMIGASSWMNQLEQEAINLDYIGTLLSWVPGVKATTQTIKNAVQAVKRGVVKGADMLIEAEEMILDVYSGVQHRYHQFTTGYAFFTFREVVKANDPDVDVNAFLTNMAYFESFGKAWRWHVIRNEKKLKGGKSERDFRKHRFGDFTQLVRDSRDRFTYNRHNTWFNFKIPFISEVRMEKYGGSEFEMIQDKMEKELAWDWTAMDTESFRVRFFGCGTFHNKWCGWFEIPVGWGAAHALHENAATNAYDYAQFKVKSCPFDWCGFKHDTGKWGESPTKDQGAWMNEWAAYLAASDDKTNKRASIKGLRDYYDFAKDKDPYHNKKLKPGDTSSGPGLLVYLKKPAGKVNTIKTQFKKFPNANQSPRFDVEEQGGMANDELHALAKAQPYFARPANLWPKQAPAWKPPTGKNYYHRIEHGNLYNPYWQARLIEPSAKERATILALLGLTGGP